jgi:hypothetical protein
MGTADSGQRADLIAALHRERHGYLILGRTDRAAEVDRQIALLDPGTKPRRRTRTTKEAR